MAGGFHHLGRAELPLGLLGGVGKGFLLGKAGFRNVLAHYVHRGQGMVHGGDARDVVGFQLGDVGQDFVQVLGKEGGFFLRQVDARQFGNVGYVDLGRAHDGNVRNI